MDISHMISGNLKAEDLKGREVIVTIADVKEEEIGAEKEVKACVYFQGAKKRLVANKTNLTILSGLFGSETNSWQGKKITLYGAQTNFGGKVVDAIRVKAVAQTAPVQPAAAPAVRQSEPVEGATKTIQGGEILW